MKLPITDKFLLGIFQTIEAIDQAYDFFAPRTMKEAVCPELFHLRREHARTMDRKKFHRLVYYLKKKGYIRIADISHTKGVMLTPKGAQKALLVKLQTTQKKKRLDGKWIMIIFDIPEKKRILRDMLRDMLYDLGYAKLQVSVWVCPYDVFEATQEFLRAYHLQVYVKLFVIEEIENDIV